MLKKVSPPDYYNNFDYNNNIKYTIPLLYASIIYLDIWKFYIHLTLVLSTSITPSSDLTNPIQITNPLYYYPYMITYVLFEGNFNI